MAFVIPKLQRILSFLCPRPITFPLLPRRVADPAILEEWSAQEVIKLLATPACMISARKRSFCEQLKLSPQEQDGGQVTEIQTFHEPVQVLASLAGTLEQ